MILRQTISSDNMGAFSGSATLGGLAGGSGSSPDEVSRTHVVFAFAVSTVALGA